MKRRFHFRRLICIEIISGNAAETINSMCAAGIEMENVQAVSELCCRCEISKSDYAAVQKLCSARGDELTILTDDSFSSIFRGLNRHKVLLAAIGTAVFLFLFLPTRILFITVSGNNRLNHNEIIAQAKQAGLFWGCSRRSLRSEEIKNAMIQNNPMIKWVGINTRGCLATVAVKESEANTSLEFQGSCDVIAAVDGIVDSVYSDQGTNLCYAGKYVQRGEVLISGTTDVGLCTLLRHAEGEVYARTQRFIRGILPVFCFNVEDDGRPIRYYTLLFQKSSIKMWFGSGILPLGCGKIRNEYSLSFLGGFVSPLAIRVDTVIPYDQALTELSEGEALSVMRSSCESCLSSEMIAGKIEAHNSQMIHNTDFFELQSVYHCYEMISRIRPYEIGDVYEQNN